jgi:hypothetical protein
LVVVAVGDDAVQAKKQRQGRELTDQGSLILGLNNDKQAESISFPPVLSSSVIFRG